MLSDSNLMLNQVVIVEKIRANLNGAFQAEFVEIKREAERS